MGTNAQVQTQNQPQGGARDCAEDWTSSAFLYAQNAQVQLLQRGVGTVADNLLNRRLKTSIPHQKIATDTSKCKYWLQGDDGKFVADTNCISIRIWISLMLKLSAFTSDRTPSAAEIQRALDEAIRVTADCPDRRTFHSDQGWAY